MIVKIYNNIELTIQALDEFTSLPNIKFDKIIGDDSYQYIQRVIIQQLIGNNEKKNFLIYHDGSYSPLTDENVIQDDKYLYFCSGKYVCKWNIRQMQLEWDIELDISCCFTLELMKDKKTILVAGESDISRIDLEGNILWKYSGSDILVTESGKYGAEIIGNKIYLTDWNNILHVLDFDGNLINLDSS